MKYVVLNPYSFRKFDPNHQDDYEEDELDMDEGSINDGLYTRVTYAFLFGLFQTAMGLLLEMMSIVYLCTKGSFRLILISFATMACIG